MDNFNFLGADLGNFKSGGSEDSQDCNQSSFDAADCQSFTFDKKQPLLPGDQSRKTEQAVGAAEDAFIN